MRPRALAPCDSSSSVRTHDEERRFHALGRRGHAPAKAEHRQRETRGLDDVRALVPADPLRHHDLLRMDVFEAVAPHFCEGPLDGLLELRGAAEAVTDRVGQRGQPMPGERIACRLADETGGWRADTRRATAAQSRQPRGLGRSTEPAAGRL